MSLPELPRLIGFAGPARSGKNTCADMLLPYLGPKYARAAFADPLKDMLVTGLSVTRERDLDGPHKHDPTNYGGKSPRELMQTLGTEWGRELIDPDIWVKAFNFRYWGHNCIITDVRFNNEAEYVRETGLIVHVKGRGGIPGSHKSEDGIEEAPGDVVIWNNQSERILQQRIEDLARKLVEGEVWPTRQT